MKLRRVDCLPDLTARTVMYALEPTRRHAITNVTARIFKTLAIGTLAFSAACNDNPTTEGRLKAAQPVHLAMAASAIAAPGAVIEAVLTYAPPSGPRVTLARDSVTTNTGGADAALSLTADVAQCVLNASASDGQCTLDLALSLKRDGRVLDENTQQFQVGTGTQTVQVPSVQLLEVSTVTIDTTGTGALEPGDQKTLTAVARDRSGVVVVGRNVTWSLVSGGATITAAGALTATAAGPARVSVAVGGRTGDLQFVVQATSVASIDLAPADTSIAVGGTFAYRAVAKSASGAVLAGRTITYTSSSLPTATLAANVATGVAAGLTTITARSAEGRAGAIITSATTLRVLATPSILVSTPAVTIDVALRGQSGVNAVAITTDPGRVIRGLVAAVTYSPNVTPWLTQSLVGTTTPTTLNLSAAAGALDTGTYTADVRLTSTLDLHVPATVRVTMRVVRIVAVTRTVSFGPFTPSQTQVTPITATLRTSMATVPLSGLTTVTQYIGTGTGWLTAALQSTTAGPTAGLLLTPNPVGLASGVYQARVIVSSATPVVTSDTIAVDMTVGLSGRFSGLVLSAQTQQAISGVTVTIRRLDNTVADQVTTSATGAWTSNALLAGTYNITFSVNGFQDFLLFGQVLAGDVSVPTTPLATARMVPTGSGVGRILGDVRDATTNFVVAGATVDLRAGSNNTTGVVIATATTTANGNYVFTAQPSGTYTVSASKTNFTPGSVTVTVLNVDVTAPVTFLSPIGTSIAWRFVLSWGSSPLDLDAHLTGPIQNSAQRFHVFFANDGSSSSSPFALLDVDVQNGFGPETITLYQQFTGVYRFYVDNFSGSPEIRTSTARVDVYQGNTLVRQFFPPQQNGKFWSVFEIDAAVLTPINTINNVAPQIRAPNTTFTRGDPRSQKALEELMNLQPWTWTKPTGAIKR